ncbi:MAG: hypothetical protein NTU88_09455, partial [Armatimonadetes bacterium]|nr:hypothetical protein [Armatimonadota bacterium]
KVNMSGCFRCVSALRLIAIVGATVLAGLPSPTAVASPSLYLPVVSDSSDLLQSCVAGPSVSSALKLEGGAMGTATNNVGSIWGIDDKNQPARDFGDGSAYAMVQYSKWLRLHHRAWWVGYGLGKRSIYLGNADAAQLWIDLHAAGQTQPIYAASAEGARADADWLEFGRGFPFRIADQVRGTGRLSLRRIDVPDYLARSVVGDMEGEMFTAMLREVSARSPRGTVHGAGWALDGQIRLNMNGKWLGQATAEGLLGRVTWDEILVDDSGIVSPRTFTDPEGFLHDCGGITGTTWRENLSLRVTPYYRLDLIRIGRPYLLFGTSIQSGIRSTPNLGVAWPQRKKWLPYVKYYPAEGRLEVGGVGAGWQFRISGDDWIYSSPKHAEVAVSAQALRF